MVKFLDRGHDVEYELSHQAEIEVEFTSDEAVPGTVHQWFRPQTLILKDGVESFPRGPWTNEPAKIQWVEAKTGLPCLIVRGPMGALCGYVGVFPGHPYHKIGYSQCTLAYGENPCDPDHSPESSLDVHGGLTFAGPCLPSLDGDPGKGICHIPDPGVPDDVWWFGFDCCHWQDLSPVSLAFRTSLIARGVLSEDVPSEDVPAKDVPSFID